jgi:hypothetical protein
MSLLPEPRTSVRDIVSEHGTKESRKPVNKRRRRSQYAGVRLTRYGTYEAYVSPNGGHKLGVGYWPSERQAAIAHDRALIHLRLDERRPMNFQAESRRLGPLAPERLRAEARQLAKLTRSDSRYRGVWWDAQDERWICKIKIGQRRIEVARYRTEEAAATAYDRVAVHFGKPEWRNFPERPLEPASPSELREEARAEYKSRTTSSFEGVYFKAQSAFRPWEAQIVVCQSLPRSHQTLSLGFWRTELDAAKAYDRAALFYRGPSAKLNFPDSRSTLVPAQAETLAVESRAQFKATTTSRFRGVYWKKGKWVAQIHAGYVRQHLGHFDDEHEAALAYDRAARAEFGARARLNFHPDTGEELGGKRIGDPLAPIAHTRRPSPSGVPVLGNVHPIGPAEEKRRAG